MCKHERTLGLSHHVLGAFCDIMRKETKPGSDNETVQTNESEGPSFVHLSFLHYGLICM